MRKQGIRLGLIQIRSQIGSIQSNKQKILDVMHLHADKVDLFVSPELALVGYPARDLLANPRFIEEEHKACDELRAASEKLGVGLLLGHTEKRSGPGKPLFNAATLWDKGVKVGCIRKKRLPFYDIFEEERFFENFHESQNPLTFRDHSVGIFICEDAWFEVKRYGVSDRGHPSTDLDISPQLEGSDLIINLSASPYTIDKHARRRQVFEHYTKVYKCPVAFVSSVGAHDEIIFDGRSFVLDKQGASVGEAAAFVETTLIVNSHDFGNKALAITPWHDLHQALLVGIRDYVRHSGFQKILLGLSGGVDSALVATLAAQALGAENVLAVALPSAISSDHSLKDAKDLAKNLGISLKEMPIQSSVNEMQKIAGIGTSGLAFENLQSRTRGILLMALSNCENRLLLATGNKSEFAMGYATLYGDMCGALAPLGDLYKTDVYGLCHYINLAAAKNLIPVNTMTKAPSAELAPGQKDEDALLDYPSLDAVLFDILENQSLRSEKMSKFVASKYASMGAFKKKLYQNEFKRFQAPPILKVHQRSFGIGWRLPLNKDSDFL